MSTARMGGRQYIVGFRPYNAALISSMAAPQAPSESLSPEMSIRLAEFAKACKAATRVVSMYPPSHPTIQAALARIVEATRQATMYGPLPITILPDALLVH